MRASLTTLCGAIALTVGLAFAPVAAEARTSVSIGIGIGPLYYGGYYGGYYRPYWGGPYWGPAYYYPAPVYWGPSYGTTVVVPPAPIVNTYAPAIYDSAAYRQALDGPLGQTYASNDGRGTVTAVRDGYSGTKYCREFRQDVTIDGRRQEAFGAACRKI